MPYPEPEVFEFDLGGIGCPEYRVACADPRSLPWGLQVQVQKAAFVFARVALGRGVPRAEDEFAVTAMDEAVRQCLTTWNLVYPKRHPKAGQVIPLDGSEPDPLGPLPGPVYQAIVQEVGQRLMAPPKRPGE